MPKQYQIQCKYDRHIHFAVHTLWIFSGTVRSARLTVNVQKQLRLHVLQGQHYTAKQSFTGSLQTSKGSPPPLPPSQF